MPKVIVKVGYVKAGSAGGYMKYIATRERVEKLEGSGPVSENQQQLIADILRDFPDAKELYEYADYTALPTMQNASAFISTALDVNDQGRDGYMKYIATRPRVERQGEHGLFGSEQSVSLDDALDKLGRHTGNVWTLVFSLRREDAERLGFESAESWRRLIMSKRAEIAKAMKIPQNDLRWYAAFHDEGHHPHVHVMVWSDDPKRGFLTTDGMEQMRSVLTSGVFRDELLELYQEKDVAYKDLVRSAQEMMWQLIMQMRSQMCDSPAIEKKIQELVISLGSARGKKQYGYLKKEVKELVDTIVDELSAQPAVAECYEVWNRLRDELESYYHQRPREHLPLSQQKEFRAIKNIVVREAENIRVGRLSFEDERMDDEAHDDEHERAEEYAEAKRILSDHLSTSGEKADAVKELEWLWRTGCISAGHLLGKVYRDGTAVLRDMEQAEMWFQRAADAGNVWSMYALGKLMLEQKRIDEATHWLERASGEGNSYAAYLLGKLYLGGKSIPKDMSKALEYLTKAAELGNQYAQYTLGKLYLQDGDMQRDEDAALDWLTQSADQGNEYAKFVLEHRNEHHDPSILLAATNLLYHMSRIFQENSVPPTNPAGIRIDSKRRRMLMSKRMAMGHKPDNHEEVPTWQQTM